MVEAGAVASPERTRPSFPPPRLLRLLPLSPLLLLLRLLPLPRLLLLLPISPLPPLPLRPRRKLIRSVRFSHPACSSPFPFHSIELFLSPNSSLYDSPLTLLFF